MTTMPNFAELRQHVSKTYGVASAPRAIFQIVVALVVLVASWFLALYALDISPYLTMLACVPIAFMSVRLFIFQHDCGHGSFFKSPRTNEIVGSLLGIITLCPYHYWLRTHALHHASSGNLDKRGTGDISTLTISEYAALTPKQQLGYRIYRNPLVLFFIGAVFHFLVFHRWPSNMQKGWKKERWGVLLTDIALFGLIAGACWLVGWERFVIIQGPASIMSAGFGVWLFYVQHQFEDAYWKPGNEWNFEEAGLMGSTHYRLPKVVQWFTGNIGLHHVHHLSSKIPNYYLERCHNETPEVHVAPSMTFTESLRYAFLKLWDEDEKKLVTYRHARRVIAARAASAAV